MVILYIYKLLYPKVLKADCSASKGARTVVKGVHSGVILDKPTPHLSTVVYGNEICCVSYAFKIYEINK